MTPDEARVAITSLTSFPLVIHPSTSLVAAALEIAVQAGRTAYDSLYLALAVAEGCPLVTADERLFNSLQGSLLAPHVRWVADAGIGGGPRCGQCADGPGRPSR